MDESTTEQDRVRADCPECGKNKWADVVGHFTRRQDDEDSGTWLRTDYRLLQCPACESVYFQRDSVFSEDYVRTRNPITGEEEYDMDHRIEHWPSVSVSRREKPAWAERLTFVDTDLSALMDSVYKALENELDVLAAIAIRTVFDRASELLGIDPGRSFGEKLDDLLALGKIGAEEREILDTLTDAGSAAAHRGWKPTQEELDTMLSSIEGFIHRSFVLGDAIKKLRDRVRAKPKRQHRGAKTTQALAKPTASL